MPDDFGVGKTRRIENGRGEAVALTAIFSADARGEPDLHLDAARDVAGDAPNVAIVAVGAVTTIIDRSPRLIDRLPRFLNRPALSAPIINAFTAPIGAAIIGLARPA